MQTLRLAFKNLRKQPGFALLAILTLAVGIGPTTAVYAVFRQVLLRELPVHKPGELVLLQANSAFETGSMSSWGGADKLYFAPPAYRALRAADPRLAAAARQPVNFTTAKDAVSTSAQLVSGNYFSLLGERPLLGRLLTDEDDRVHAANPVAVLNESFWRSHFGANPAVLNTRTEINGAPFTVVGVVADQGVMDAEPVAVFVPEAMQQAISLGRPDTQDDALSRWLLVLGRAQSGNARAQLQAKLNGTWITWRRDVLHTRAGSIGNKAGWMQTTLHLVSGARGVSLLQSQLGTPVLALQAMAALVLLVACANLASLLLARAAGQRSRMAIRACLGASRLQIIAATMANGLLIGAIGTATGMVLGWVCLRLLSHAFLQTDNYTGMVLAAPWHWSVVLFAVGAGLLTSLLFSLGPALAHARINPAEVLHSGLGVVGGTVTRTRNILVTATIALSLLLLLSATLVGWNLYRLSTTSPGFALDHLLTLRVDESATGASQPRTAAVYASLLEGMEREHGVSTVAYAQEGLLAGDQIGNNISIAGRANKENDPVPNQNWVSAGFFRTLGIAVLRGREFTDADTAASEPVAVVDQAFVRVFFGGDTVRALGEHFGFGAGDKMKFNVRIVGVISTFHADSIHALPGVPYLYLAYPQTYGSPSSPGNPHAATFYIRSTGDPKMLATDMRALMHRIDPRLPVLSLQTMREQVSANIADTRLLAILSSMLGALSALLAAVGLYGVLAYQVATRTREIGLRMALGASRVGIARLLFGRMLRLTAWGFGLGAASSYGVARLFGSQIADLTAAPPWLYAGASLLLLAAAFAASAVPAWRAAHIDPMEALRSE